MKNRMLLVLLAATAWTAASAEPAKPAAKPAKSPLPSAEAKAAKPADGAKPGDPERKGPTEITSTKGAQFDNKEHKAIFEGDVKVKDPQFSLDTDLLTVFLAPEKDGGGLERAIAEGNVHLIQDKPDPKGGPPQRSEGRSESAIYIAKTGDVTLKGWPQIRQGFNLHVATERWTVMYLNRDGKLRTEGPSKTIIVEQPEEPKKTPNPNATRP